MGRGRRRAKKQSAIADTGSGEDEKLPVKRRGRPQKPMKDEIDEEDEVEKIEEEDDDGLELSKATKTQTGSENGRKRKRPSQMKENSDPVAEENGVGTKNNAAVLIKPVGYRQIGSRRKNKPRRAAEVGVECK